MVGSMRCAACRTTACRSTPSSSTSWRRACSAEAASRPARATSSSVRSWSRPGRRSLPSGGSRRGGSDSGFGCSAIIGSCSPARRCWPVAQRVRLVPSRLGLSRAAVAPSTRGHLDGRRRLALHRLRDGRVATLDASGDRRTDRRDRCDVSGARVGRSVLRGAARARRPARRRRRPGCAGDGIDAGRGTDRRELRRMRRSV